MKTRLWSLNLFFEDPNRDALQKAHFYGWKQGLKTGLYYLRTQPSVKSATFTYESDKEDHTDHEKSDHEDKEPKKPRRKKTQASVSETDSKQEINSEESKVHLGIGAETTGSDTIKVESKQVAFVEGLVVENEEGCEMCGS